jgi:hypothetical protein
MTHALLGGKSGWGKSWTCQWWTEDNAPDYEYLLVLDYKDEYRGLVKAGLANWGIAGPDEVGVGADAWREALERNKRLVLTRHRLRTEQWREVCAETIRAARSLEGSVLIVIDEAHFVAPQSGKFPDVIEGLATTGRGERVSSLWVSQRLAKVDEDIISQMMVYLLGGFTSDADQDKIAGVVEYPVAVHNPQVSQVSRLPEELHADDGPVPVRKFTDRSGSTVGSEWVYSTDKGEFRRIDTRDLSMDSTHYGPEGESLSTPG